MSSTPQTLAEESPQRTTCGANARCVQKSASSRLHAQVVWVRSFFCLQAIVAGDFILSVSSCLLAQIRNNEVVKVLSQVLEDLVTGVWCHRRIAVFTPCEFLGTKIEEISFLILMCSGFGFQVNSCSLAPKKMTPNDSTITSRKHSRKPPASLPIAAKPYVQLYLSTSISTKCQPFC